MPALHRRRVLSGAAALLTGLAGCSDSTTESESVPAERRPENVARDPDAVSLRGPETDGPLAWLPTGDAAGSGDPDGPDSTADSAAADALRRGLVASRTEADRLRFADVDGADDARRFVAETDFETETLYVERHEVRECSTLKLCYVTWSATEIDTRYGRYYRDADVSCEADATDATVRLVRIPDALDPDEVTNRGSGVSGSGCRYPPYMQTSQESPKNGTRQRIGDPETTANTSETTATLLETGAER